MNKTAIEKKVKEYAEVLDLRTMTVEEYVFTITSMFNNTFKAYIITEEEVRRILGLPEKNIIPTEEYKPKLEEVSETVESKDPVINSTSIDKKIKELKASKSGIKRITQMTKEEKLLSKIYSLAIVLPLIDSKVYSKIISTEENPISSDTIDKYLNSTETLKTYRKIKQEYEKEVGFLLKYTSTDSTIYDNKIETDELLRLINEGCSLHDIIKEHKLAFEYVYYTLMIELKHSNNEYYEENKKLFTSLIEKYKKNPISETKTTRR